MVLWEKIPFATGVQKYQNKTAQLIKLELISMLEINFFTR